MGKLYKKTAVFILTLLLATGVLSVCNVHSVSAESIEYDGVVFDIPLDNAKVKTLDRQTSTLYDRRILPAGNYYLTDDLDISQTLMVQAGSANRVNLYLNGHSITMDSYYEVLRLEGDAGRTGNYATYFNIYDKTGSTGKITHKEGVDGIGIFVGRNGYLETHNVTISGNKGGNCGGGVYLVKSTHFNMYGGSITGNSADEGGGVYATYGSNLALHGTVIIDGNTKNNSSTKDNVFLCTNAMLDMYHSSDLSPDSTVGITTEAKPSGYLYWEGVQLYYESRRLHEFGKDQTVLVSDRDDYTVYLEDRTNVSNDRAYMSYKADYEYTVNFETYCDSWTVLEQKVESMEHVVEPEIVGDNPKPGYTLESWYKDTRFREMDRWDFNNGVTENMTLYARWIPNKYVVTYYPGNDEAEFTKEVTFDSTYGEQTTPLNPGYKFIGWYTTPEGGEKIESTTKVTTIGDHNLYAHYELGSYTVAWLDNDGTVLELDEGVAGLTQPHFDGTTKSEDAYGYYDFLGWSPEITADTKVVSDMVYTAQYEKKTTKSYTVKFIDEDGTTVNVKPYDAGTLLKDVEVPSVTKESTAEYDYTQRGLLPSKNDDDELLSNLTFMIIFSRAKRKYNITYNYYENGNPVTRVVQQQEYGAWPDIPEVPVRAGYFFTGWSPVIDYVDGDKTYTAQYVPDTSKKYTVIWLNEEKDKEPLNPLATATEISSDHEAEINIYNIEYDDYGITPPSKAYDDQYTYSFANDWLTEVDEDNSTVYKIAKFNRALRKFTITWVNDDDTVLDTDEVEYGSRPEYKGATPVSTRTPAEGHTYTFTGWDRAVVPATANAEYTAKYLETVNKYTITWKDGDTILEQQSVEHGKVPYCSVTPSKEADAQYTYTFAGWNPAVTVATKDEIYDAVYTKTLNTYVVTINYPDGSSKTLYKNYGSTLTAEELGTPTTTYFDGWYDSDDNLIEQPLDMPIHSNTVIYAKTYSYACIKSSPVWVLDTTGNREFIFARVLDTGAKARKDVDNDGSFVDTYDSFINKGKEARVDGTRIFENEGDFTHEEGSLKMYLNDSLLNTLSVGTHILTVEFEDGSASVSFTVVKKSEPITPDYRIPKTGIE